MKDKFLLEQKMSEAVVASESESEAYPKEKDKAEGSEDSEKASGSEDKSDKSSDSEDRSEKALDSENGSEKESGSKDNCENITSRPRGSKKKVGKPSRTHANVPFKPSKIGDASATRRRGSYQIDTNLDDSWIQDPYILSPCEMPFHAFSRFGGAV